MELLERENFDVLLTDFRLPSEDGMKLIARAKSLARPPICILMTAYGSEELAVDAMKRGADDYIAKGRLQIDELEMRIARAAAPAKPRNRKRFVAPAARHQVRPGKHRRQIAGDGGNFRGRSAGGAVARHGFAHRRERHGQGTRGPGDSPAQSAREAAAGDRAWRGAGADVAGKRIVRPRKGRVHRRARAAHRPFRAGAGRHAVSGRNRRD